VRVGRHRLKEIGTRRGLAHDREHRAVTAEQFGPYVLESLLGAGGMGQVFRAHDTRRDRRVALKLLAESAPVDDDCLARFRREQHVAARLTDPHIVPIHDFGEIDGRLFLDMRLVEGRDLGQVLADDGPLDATSSTLGVRT
jgi:serine/threonine-protein kinase